MLLVPTGRAYLLCICLRISSPISCWNCLHSVAAEPVVTMMRMYLRLLSSCTQWSASSNVEAAVRRCCSVTGCVACSASLNMRG